MLFNSYEFIVFFLPVSVLGFFILAHKNNRYSIIWLVFVSLFFYAWWNTDYLLLICSSIVINFVIATKISRNTTIGASSKSLYWLITGLLFNLVLLFYYKYSNFFLSSISDSLVGGLEFDNILLPIGISFFTFQQIAYLIDTRRKITVQHGFIDYSLFVLFFPQLIAGPIVHHSQILPQFTKKKIYCFCYKNLAIGLTIFSIGLFKKVVVADNLSAYVNPAFDAAELGQVLTFFESWTATLAYSLQIYFDFSGYSDMAIGLARLFGIKLPINFYSPYKANNIIEFWQRWHITLSKFLRDYVYIPLGGNRKGARRHSINLMLTMILAGLWHGAAWTFIAWGAVHGFYIIINHLWIKLNFSSNKTFASVLLARSLTLFAIIIAWVLFRADSIDAAITMYTGMLNLPRSLLENFDGMFLILNFIGFHFSNYSVSLEDLIVLLSLLLSFVILWFVPNTYEFMARFQPSYNFDEDRTVLAKYSLIFNITWKPTLLWSILAALLFLCSFMSLSQVSEFLYFQF